MTKHSNKPAKRAWRPRARKAWTPPKGLWFHQREAYPKELAYGYDEPVRIVPEADYQRLLEMAGLKTKGLTKKREGEAHVQRGW